MARIVSGAVLLRVDPEEEIRAHVEMALEDELAPIDLGVLRDVVSGVAHRIGVSDEFEELLDQAVEDDWDESRFYRSVVSEGMRSKLRGALGAYYRDDYELMRFALEDIDDQVRRAVLEGLGVSGNDSGNDPVFIFVDGDFFEAEFASDLATFSVAYWQQLMSRLATQFDSVEVIQRRNSVELLVGEYMGHRGGTVEFYAADPIPEGDEITGYLGRARVLGFDIEYEPGYYVEWLEGEDVGEEEFLTADEIVEPSRFFELFGLE